MTTTLARVEQVRENLNEANKHLDAALNALTAAACRADFRTASAIARVIDAVERAQENVPYMEPTHA